MVILKENVGPTHRHFMKSFGDFTQVKITAVMKNGDEIPVAQFFGMTAKIHANKFLEAMGWNDVHVDLTQ